MEDYHLTGRHQRHQRAGAARGVINSRHRTAGVIRCTRHRAVRHRAAPSSGRAVSRLSRPSAVCQSSGPQGLRSVGLKIAISIQRLQDISRDRYLRITPVSGGRHQRLSPVSTGRNQHLPEISGGRYRRLPPVSGGRCQHQPEVRGGIDIGF